ncbi:MAG: diguanylate cyclase [Pseudomonadota bacterium]
MKIFFALLVVFFTFALNADTQSKKRIFILHSYAQEYEWTKLQHLKFVSSLEESLSFPLEISTEYLDTKRLKFDEEYQSFFLHYLQKKYNEYNPDVIYVTDDNALTFFSNHQKALFVGKPIFFSGINNLFLLSSLDPKKFTGVYETKDIEPNIELIKQFSPQTRDIWIVGDRSTTYQAIESDIKKKIHHFPKYTFHFLSTDKIDEIMQQLPKTPKSFVLLTTIGGWSDQSGRILTLKESINTLKSNKHLILCSMEDAYLLGGVVGGFVTSGANQGLEAAKLATRYFSGEPLSSIHSIIKSPNGYIFDRRALIESRLILSEYTARNAIILNEKKNFFEQHQEMILNTLFIVMTLFLIFLIIVYFVALQKKSHLHQVESELDECSTELLVLKEKLALMKQQYE